jgi:hypothetical protein
MLCDQIKFVIQNNERQNTVYWVEGRQSRIMKYSLHLVNGPVKCLLKRYDDLIEVYVPAYKVKCYMYDIMLYNMCTRELPATIEFIPAQ